MGIYELVCVLRGAVAGLLDGAQAVLHDGSVKCLLVKFWKHVLAFEFDLALAGVSLGGVHWMDRRIQLIELARLGELVTFSNRLNNYRIVRVRQCDLACLLVVD